MQNQSVTRRAVIGIGSNQNALFNLRQALLELRIQPHFKILKVSRIYESLAQLPEGAPEDWNQPFLNAAVLIEIQNFDSIGLLEQLKNIEIRLGRIDSERWSPRQIDLDILFIENLIIKNDFVQIPHPRLFERPFAFLPAREVFPDLPRNEKEKNNAFETIISNRFFWPEFVGILNVTPDSFSDGGLFNERDHFLKQARKLILDGADYLDLGAESTRPAAKIVQPEEELKRLKQSLSYLEELKSEGLQFKVSIDSRNFHTLRALVDDYKIDLINDVSGLSDSKMLELIKSYNLKAVCMHSLTVPAQPDVVFSSDLNPVEEILNWWTLKENKFLESNLENKNIYFDPGFGFGKTIEQNRHIFNHIEDFFKIHNKFFMGYSRKSFLNYSSSRKASDRDLETSLATQRVNPAFCQFLRVHDIQTQKIALRVSHGL